MVGADCSLATAPLVHNGQTRCLLRVEFAPGFFKGFTHAAAGGRGTHNVFDRNLRGPPVIGCHAVTQVAFGHDAYQATALFVFHNGRTPASRPAHRLRGIL
jgi:hypothetical protein